MRRGSGSFVLLACLAIVADGCGTTTPTPPPVNDPAPTPTASQAAGGPGILDACDPAGLVACDQQAAFISIPIADTGVALTWSSQWAPGRTDRAGWDASGLGLGGWSFDVVERYDPADHVLIDGDGSWRSVMGVAVPSGGTAVPTYDGSTATVFDGSGHQVSTVDGLLGTTLLTTAYDADGRLTSVEGTWGGHPVHAAIIRGSDGTAQAVTGIDGAKTLLHVDGNGQLDEVTDPIGRPTSFAWAEGGLITSETDPLNGVTHYAYDQDGRLVGSSDADGVTTQWSRAETPTSIEVTATTALGRTTTYRTESSAAGTTRTVVGADGTTTTETTSPDGSIALTLPDGTKRTISMVPHAIWGAAVPVPRSDVTARTDGVRSTTEVAESLTAAGGRPEAESGTITTTVNGAASVESVDPSARTISVKDASGRASSRTYDQAGRIVAETAPGVPPLAVTYDADGRQSSVTVGTGATARTWRDAYDTATGTLVVTRPDGSSQTQAVDSAGDGVSSSTADGATVVEGHDADGRLTQLQPAGGLAYTLGYSAAGRPTLFLPPAVASDGSAETTTYDTDGLPTAINGPGQRSTTLTYDPAGRVSGRTVAGGTVTTTYDPSGQMATASDPAGESVAYGFASGQPDSLHWSGLIAGSVATTLDSNGRLTSEAIDGSAGDVHTYDPSGQLTGIGQLSLTRDPASGLVTDTALGPVRTVVTYDGADQLARATTSVSGSVVLDDRYTRDAIGRIATVVETTPGGTTTIYTYDGSDRLASVRVNDRSTETDTYDAAGNRVRSVTPAGSTVSTYDARDRLMRAGADTYAWAPDGSLASISRPSGTTTFAFDELGRLRAVHLPGGRTIDYVVDADGRRVGREVDGDLTNGYLYDPAGRVVAQTDGSGAVVARFAYDDQGHLVTMQEGAKTYRIVTDAVGSPRLVIDAASGAVAEAIDYDTWGRIAHDTTPGFIPFGYAGGLLDPGTGLVQFGARDYDPSIGRWTASDPIRFEGGDADLYRYVADDPVDRTDPAGTASVCYGDLCGNGSWNGGNPDLHGCYGSACIRWCWYECNKPNDPFTCVGLFCMRDACILTSCIIGDTHVYTGDGVHYDFQAAGEFIAATTPDGSLEIQSRQQPVLGGTQITFDTAVAALVDGDRVGVYADEPSFLVVNGKAVTAADIAERLPGGGSLERHGGTVTVRWTDGSSLTVTEDARTLELTFVPSTSLASSLHGLLGDENGDKTDDLTERDGTVLDRPDPDFATKVYSQFGDSWRIKPSESLFDYRPGESTATFTDLSIPSAPVTVDSIPATARAAAQTICLAAGVRSEPLLDDCLIDVGMTGDATYVAATAAIAAAGTLDLTSRATGSAPTPSSSPSPGPSLPPTPVGPIAVGQTVRGSITAPTDRADYTFTGTAGQVIYLQAHDACTGTLGWNLLAPGGGDLGGSLICSDLQREVLKDPGTYTVRVNADENASGPFSFTVLAVPATVVAPVTIGQAMAGSLTTAGQQADYTFSGTAGQVVYLEHGDSCTAQIDWELRPPSGGSLGSTSSCNDLGRTTLRASGTYTVRFFGDHVTTGPYAFTLLAVPATVVTPVALGQTVSGALAGPGQQADYTFTATPGQAIQAHALGACVDGLGWQLLGPDGGLLDFTVACHDLGPDTLKTAGTYTIRVSGDRTSTGAYSFTLQPGG